MSLVRMHFAANTRNEVQRFISFDELGTLCKLRHLRNTRKASETGCRNEDSLHRGVSAPRNAYIFFGSSISVIFLSKRLPCHAARNILIFRIRVIGERRGGQLFPPVLFLLFVTPLSPNNVRQRRESFFLSDRLNRCLFSWNYPASPRAPCTGCGCVYCL